MIRETAISKTEVIDVAKAQAIRNKHTKEALDNLKVMKKQFKQARELEIRSNREITLSRSKAIDLDR